MRVTQDPDYAKAECDAQTYVVIATQHKSDYEALQRVLRQSPAYVGLVASRKRSALVLERLHEDGMPLELLRRVAAPAGLDIGAVTPQEIALSIFVRDRAALARRADERPAADGGEGRADHRRGRRGAGRAARIREVSDLSDRGATRSRRCTARSSSSTTATRATARRSRTPTAEARAVNPSAAIRCSVEVELAGGRIAAVSSRARGCSIAVASGSVMTELVQGDTPAVARELGAALEKVVRGDSPGDGLDDRLRAFRRVAALPSRRRCATLAWEALAEAVGRGGGVRGGFVAPERLGTLRRAALARELGGGGVLPARISARLETALRAAHPAAPANLILPTHYL